MTSLTSMIQLKDSWWKDLLSYGTIAMKLFSAVVGEGPFNGKTLPIGSAQCILVRPDDLLRRSRWVYKGTSTDVYMCPFSRMYPHTVSVRISNVAPVSSRRGKIAALFQPLTMAECLSAKITSGYLERNEVTPTFEFDELIRLPGVKVVSASQQLTFSYRIPVHSWMREGVMIGVQTGSGSDPAGVPIGRLYLGYRDLANEAAGSTGLYGPDEACFSVDISVSCSFDGFGTRELVKYPTKVYDASSLGVLCRGTLFNVPWEDVTVLRHGMMLSPEWVSRINNSLPLEDGELTEEFCQVSMCGSP